MSKVFHEITPLAGHDCFMIFEREKPQFDFPVHYHEEFELTFIENGAGASRMVGDNIEKIGNYDLVMLGPNLPHGWLGKPTDNGMIHEITLQFHKDLFDEKFLNRNQLSFVKALFEYSNRGVKFSEDTILRVRERLISLIGKRGFDSVLELISILHDLSVSNNFTLLASSGFANKQFDFKGRRLEKVFNYMKENFDKEITLNTLSKLVNMTEVSFSRYIKQRTGLTFTECLNNIRLGHAARLLIDTNYNISEVSFKSGYNNLSYFNRIFRKKYNCTPKEFREDLAGTRTFV